RLLDDEIVRASERGLDLRRAGLGSEEVVRPAKRALPAAQRGQAVDRAAERRAGIARRRRDEDALERRRAEQPIVRAAVQARAAGEAEVARTGPRVQPAGDLEERLLERALARGSEVRGVLEAAAAIGAAFRADPAFGAAIPE